MKKIALAVSLFVSALGFSQTYNSDFLDGSILVKLDRHVQTPESVRIDESLVKYENLADYPNLKKALRDFSVSELSRPIYYTGKEDLQKIYRVKFDNYAEIDAMVKKLNELPGVEYAEKEPIYKLSFVPNDPNYTNYYKWYHDVVGAEQAWDITLGSNNIKVAIVDNAVMGDHEDLTTFKMRDVADNDDQAAPPNNSGSWNHGTHVAGLATADVNNGVGIASLGGNVELIGIKSTPDNAANSNSVYYGFNGVAWACANGANVVSMSYGGPSAQQAMQNLINSYPEIVFLAAAGNDGNSTIQYPGGYDNVICVGSVDGDGDRSSFSNYNAGGQSWVDICAPGGYTNGGLLSCGYNTGNGTYVQMGGTSMATPYAAGLVGAMLSLNPTLTSAQIESCIKTTGSLTPSGNIGELMNAPAALNCVAATVTGDPLPQFVGSPVSIFEGQSVTFLDQSADGGNAITNWEWSFPGGTPSSHIGQTPPAITYATAGIYTVELTVTNSQSQQTKTRTDYINVSLEPYGEWIIQNSNFTNTSTGIGHIDIVDANTVWAVSYDGSGGAANYQEFTKTTDGGANWTVGTIDVGDVDLGISMITAIDDQTAWLVAYPQQAGDVGGIWKTTDGGSTWNRQNSATYNDASGASFSNVVHFWDANNGFCQGDPINGEYELYTTTDGGANWNLVPGANIPNPLNANEYGYVRDIEVVGDTVWFGTNTGRLYRSPDKGYTWEVFQTPETDMGNASYSFRDGGTGLMNVGGTIYRSTDGGETWNQVTTTGTVAESNICYIEGTDVVFSTGTGSSYSEDGGTTWNVIDTDQHTYVEFLNPSIGWSGYFTQTDGSHGIWKWNNLNSYLDVDFKATPLNACVGDTIFFTDLTTGGNVQTWTWSFPGATSPDNTVQNPIAFYATAGTYSVQLTVTDSTEQVTHAKSAYVTIVEPPSAPVVVGGPSTVCQDSSVNFATVDDPDVFFVWTLPADWTGNSITNTIVATVGTMSGDVSVAASNACGVSAAKTKAVTVENCGTVGVEELGEAVYNAYPNPATATFNVSVNNKLLNSTLRVFDVVGNLVYTTNINSNVETIDVSAFAKGMYFVKVDGIDNPIKFIKE